MLKLARFIDSLTENVGYFNAFLILPLIGVVGFEVVMRYGFNAPTIWAFEATTLIYGVHFMLAFAHAHNTTATSPLTCSRPDCLKTPNNHAHRGQSRALYSDRWTLVDLVGDLRYRLLVQLGVSLHLLGAALYPFKTIMAIDSSCCFCKVSPS
ncbi:MAG: hypothetical protein R3F37_06785 [Candidatus Competibacteraceae bacterium]